MTFWLTLLNPVILFFCLNKFIVKLDLSSSSYCSASSIWFLGFCFGTGFGIPKKYVYTKWLRASLEMKLAERAQTPFPHLTHASCGAFVWVWQHANKATVDPPPLLPLTLLWFLLTHFQLQPPPAMASDANVVLSLADQRSSAQPWVD